MPKTPSLIEQIQMSVRLPVRDHGWLMSEAKEYGTIVDALRKLVEDGRTFYGLPDNMRDLLDDEAKRLGKTRRDYIVHLLGLRCEELMRGATKRGTEKSSRSKR